ncbi:hypothetical protein C5613_31385 [Rhodococcus opacus]|uniref:DUF6545 domain-containing protein n=1 Tax=Rhodococcus opacus TaxID=37919 RepID=A0A2S8IW26_RHOOP|nr:hypothetical protein C5613_31385 [Rhodococcus opacus]
MISRFGLVRSRHARIVTVLILCFTAVDTLKAGPINDALTFYLDARTVRLAAHVLCVIAAAVAAWAAASAAKRLRPARLAAGVVTASAVLIVFDGLAGQRDRVIEAVHPQGIAVAYFTIYAGSIVVFEAYAATVLAAAIRTDRPNRGLLAPSATVVALFLATGLNALTLLWYAIRAAAGDIGPVEQFQRNSNGNLFAYFTLVVALVGATAVIRRTSGESAVNRSSVNVTELQVLWRDLTDAAPHVKLDMKDLDPDARTVRMITECIDTLYDLGLDPATVTIADLHSSPSAPNSTTLTDSRVTATDVINLARRWDSQSLRD